MERERKQYVIAVVTLVGTIVGVGIFGVPYAMSQVGLWVAVGYFVLLSAIQLLQSLYFAEASIACDEKLRFPGLVGRYLGPHAKHVAATSTILGFWGGLIAYVLVGGVFLHTLLSPWLGGIPFHYQLAWGIIGGFIVLLGLDLVSKIDLASTVVLFIAMTVIAFIAMPHVDLANVRAFIPDGDFFLPYGVILFSLSGFAAIPEMEDILEGRHTHYRSAIAVGTTLAAALTFVFGFIVYGVSGDGTTTDAVLGLQPIIGDLIASFMAAFGFLAVATSYFIIGVNLRSTFEYDYRVPDILAWLLAAGVPILVLLAGAKNFIEIIGFSGAVFGGVGATMVALLYVAVKKKHKFEEHMRSHGHVFDRPLGLPTWTAYVSVAVLLFGAGYQVYSTLTKWLG